MQNPWSEKLPRTGLKALVLVLLALPRTSLGSWMDWYFSWRNGPGTACSALIKQSLAREQWELLAQEFLNERRFKQHLAQLQRNFGFSAEELRTEYQRLASAPELRKLMRGWRVENGIRVRGSWARDVLFVPSTVEHFVAVDSNFAPLAGRLGRKLHLDPCTTHKLFTADHIGLNDSAWVLASWERDGTPVHASVKITHYNPKHSPDGLWPRFALDHPFTPYVETYYRVPRTLPQMQAALAEEGYAYLTSSLSGWGYLPLEHHTGITIPEHTNLLSHDQKLSHYLTATSVVEAHARPELGAWLERLKAIRTRNFPPASLRVAEIQRFSIEAGAPKNVRPQLLYALRVLLKDLDVDRFYLLAPRAVGPTGPNRPQIEIAFVQPGWEWLAEAARELDAETHPDPYPVEASAPARDLLREQYEDLGFSVWKTLSRIEGLPNGGHIMFADKQALVQRLATVLLRTPEHFSPQQVEFLKSP